MVHTMAVTLAKNNVDSNDLERSRETKLLKAVRDSSDKTAYRELYKIMAPKLTAWLCAQGMERSLAENILQEVMIIVWTKPYLFDEKKAAARTWIYTLVRNKMIDEYRSNTRKKSGLQKFELLSNIDQVVDTTDLMSTTRPVNDIISTLPKEQKQILYMLYSMGMSHREVSETLGLPIGTVKSRTRLAFQRLRRNIGENQWT